MLARKRALAAEKKREAQERTPTRGRKVNVEKAWELYYFIVFAVGGALRTGEAYSLRWMDCSETVLNTPGTDEDAIHVRVLGKHSRGGQRENGWVLMGGVDAYQQLKQRREGDRPEDKVFRFNHEPESRELLKSLDLYIDPSSEMSRNTKSLRVTGINLRLLKNPGVPSTICGNGVGRASFGYSTSTIKRIQKRVLRESLDEPSPRGRSRSVSLTAPARPSARCLTTLSNTRSVSLISPSHADGSRDGPQGSGVSACVWWRWGAG